MKLLLLGLAISISLLLSILAYYYIINMKNTVSVEDLDREYIEFLNKLNNENNVGQQRVYDKNT